MKFLFWQTLYKNSLKSLSILLLFIVFVKLKFSKSNLIKSQLLTILLNSFDKNLGIGFSSSKCFEISKEFIKIDIPILILSRICSCIFLILTSWSKYFLVLFWRNLAVSWLTFSSSKPNAFENLFESFIKWLLRFKLNSLNFSSNLLSISLKYFFVCSSISFIDKAILSYSSPYKLFAAILGNLSTAGANISLLFVLISIILFSASFIISLSFLSSI